jgi:hypothetical protein
MTIIVGLMKYVGELGCLIVVTRPRSGNLIDLLTKTAHTDLNGIQRPGELIAPDVVRNLTIC